MFTDKEKYDCETCPYPWYNDGYVVFCDVCIRKILDERNEYDSIKVTQAVY
jgi:hypothetical protein